MKSIGLFLRYKVGCLVFIYLYIYLFRAKRGTKRFAKRVYNLVAREVQYSIFIKTPLRSSSDLIYKMEQRMNNNNVNNKWENRNKIKLRKARSAWTARGSKGAANSQRTSILVVIYPMVAAMTSYSSLKSRRIFSY